MTGDQGRTVNSSSACDVVALALELDKVSIPTR